ncbi:nucleotidyl transferase AbiEii/AbiGii toxin family protein [Fodinisporobacter ferrooxydans]|uniref:nucleotidyl transferase AbiEii/AbiGii toxin family protein n=1 Tax=Fodinisporobacter ferrooxydans TaxID=2901836 RepID=UPI00324229C1
MDYPVLLHMASPNIQAYSTESVIAEKFEAMITLSVVNSRKKDFYDIYSLLTTENFDDRVLMEAVFEAFQRRGTHVEREHPVFSAAFATDHARVKQWIAFLHRIGVAETLGFQEVMRKIIEFLSPVYQAVITEEEFFSYWDCQLQEWLIKLRNTKLVDYLVAPEKANFQNPFHWM